MCQCIWCYLWLWPWKRGGRLRNVTEGESWLKSHILVPVLFSVPIMIWPTQWHSPPPPVLTRPHPHVSWLALAEIEKQNKKQLAGEWKVNLASTCLVLRRKRRGFYIKVHSDFSVHRLTFSWHGWHNKPSKKKLQERQSVSCQAESGQTTRPWSTKRWPVLFMWNYGRHTGNQLAASKSKNLSWWRESKFVYK